MRVGVKNGVVQRRNEDSCGGGELQTEYHLSQYTSSAAAAAAAGSGGSGDDAVRTGDNVNSATAVRRLVNSSTDSLSNASQLPLLTHNGVGTNFGVG